MPSTSPAQARLMAACAHGAGYAACPPVAVAKEWTAADRAAGVEPRRQVVAALLARRRGGGR